jgi:predicted amidohydrolase YtcJ
MQKCDNDIGDSVAEAFAVSGNRISAVGSNKLIRTLIGPSTRAIDAEGRLVLPGFNDAHVHFMAIGNSFSSIDLRYAATAVEMTQRISRYVQFLPKGPMDTRRSVQKRFSITRSETARSCRAGKPASFI